MELFRRGWAPGEAAKSENTRLLIPVVGILEVCAEKAEFRRLICASDMILNIVRNLSSSDVALQVGTPDYYTH